MTEIETYLRRAGRWMPPGSSTRVMAGLREDIEEQLEGESDPARVADVLRRFGPPEVAAARYLGARPVINAMLAPAYYTVLALSLVVATIVHVSLLARSVAIGRSLPEAASTAGGNALVGLIATYAVVTLAFTLLSRAVERGNRGRQQCQERGGLP